MGEAVARHSLGPLTSEGEAEPATRARSRSGKVKCRLQAVWKFNRTRTSFSTTAYQPARATWSIDGGVTGVLGYL